jgi:hypothetical protein
VFVPSDLHRRHCYRCGHARHAGLYCKASAHLPDTEALWSTLVLPPLGPTAPPASPALPACPAPPSPPGPPAGPLPLPGCPSLRFPTSSSRFSIPSHSLCICPV